jgi:hypothetical protein
LRFLLSVIISSFDFINYIADKILNKQFAKTHRIFNKPFIVIDKGLIYVNHVVDFGTIFTEYMVNPERGLIPVCHAILYKTKPAMTIETLKAKLNLYKITRILPNANKFRV